MARAGLCDVGDYVRVSKGSLEMHARGEEKLMVGEIGGLHLALEKLTPARLMWVGLSWLPDVLQRTKRPGLLGKCI